MTVQQQVGIARVLAHDRALFWH